MKLTGIKTIIWDLDNTLYARIPDLDREAKEMELTVICNHTGWDRNTAQTELAKIRGVKFQSDTAASAFLANIPVSQAAIEMEMIHPRAKYLIRDDRLIAMFGQLAAYTHYIFSNGGKEGIEKALTILGLPLPLFREIVTSEITGVNKPDPAGYRYIMGKTKLPPDTHLMVGDRDRVDIEPAKNLGMKTCLVWGVSPIATVSVPTVYDIPNLLT